MKLTRESELAAQWNLSLEQMHILRRRHGWAHVRFSRQDIRYTDEQIVRIVHDLTTTKPKTNKDAGTGLTSRSAKRAS